MKRNTTKILSKDEKKSEKEQFGKLFPAYYNEWGNNMSKQDLGRLEDILEIMEVDYFEEEIKSYLQEKEKERIIKKKKEDNRGWFSKPKELKPE